MLFWKILYFFFWKKPQHENIVRKLAFLRFVLIFWTNLLNFLFIFVEKCQNIRFSGTVRWSCRKTKENGMKTFGSEHNLKSSHCVMWSPKPNLFTLMQQTLYMNENTKYALIVIITNCTEPPTPQKAVRLEINSMITSQQENKKTGHWLDVRI